MFILYTKFNNVQKRTNKPKNHVQYEHIEHNVHGGHPADYRWISKNQKKIQIV